jgi:hypothetical protein
MNSPKLLPAALAAVCLPWVASTQALAQPGGVPDISGFWTIDFGAAPPRRPPTEVEKSLMDRFPTGTIVLGDSGAVEFRPGDYGGVEIDPALREAAKNYDPDVQRTVATTCKPPGVIYSMQGPFPIEIFQGRDLIVMKLEYYDQVRVIFMNEQSHPDDWPHSGTGHSIGRWDGDTLVVDTAYLQPGTLFNNGVDYTENIRLLERFRLGDDGAKLVVTQEFEDPDSFRGRAARVFTLNRGNDHVYPYDCDPSYGVAIESRDRGGEQ